MNRLTSCTTFVRSIIRLLGMVLLGVVGSGSIEAQEAVVRHSFERNSEGWTVVGDAQGESVQPTYKPSGGNPGGYIEARDDATGGVWFWNAPASFSKGLQDAWSSRGRRLLVLTFDLRQSDISGPFSSDDILLSGRGLTLAFSGRSVPGTSWTSFKIPLSAAQWRIKDGGRVATEAEIAAVMESLISVRIRGEFRTGADIGGFDNVGWRWQPAAAGTGPSPGKVTRLVFVRQSETGFEPITNLRYDQAFHVEAHFDAPPNDRAVDVTLERSAGRNQRITVTKTSRDPKVFRSQRIMPRRISPGSTPPATVITPTELYRVVGVTANDRLTLRFGPGLTNAKVGKIPSGATGVIGLGEETRVGTNTWIKVNYRGVVGWVNKRYLAAQTGQ